MDFTGKSVLITGSSRGLGGYRDMTVYCPSKGGVVNLTRAIVYLASADAGFITGAALAIDGGGTAGR